MIHEDRARRKGTGLESYPGSHCHARVAGLRGWLIHSIWLLFLVLLSWSSRAEAVGDPYLEWRTIHTPHARIHYYKGLEPIANRVADLYERLHVEMSEEFGRTPSQTLEVVITDNTDSANGSATAFPYNTIRLYVTAPDDMSPLGDHDDWYLELISHEFTHILHTDSITGLPALINAVMGRTFVPNQAQPKWILEAFAVINESRHSTGGRMRSTMFDHVPACRCTRRSDHVDRSDVAHASSMAAGQRVVLVRVALLGLGNRHLWLGGVARGGGGHERSADPLRIEPKHPKGHWTYLRAALRRVEPAHSEALPEAARARTPARAERREAAYFQWGADGSPPLCATRCQNDTRSRGAHRPSEQQP